MIVRLPGEEHSGRSYNLDDEDVFQDEVRANARRLNTKLIGHRLKCGRIVCD